MPIKCFVSFRNNGKNLIPKSYDEVIAFQNKVINRMKESHPNYDYELIDSVTDEFEKDERLKYLGYSISKLQEADIILIPDDYDKSNGCQVEFFTALEYDIPVWTYFYNENDDIEGVIPMLLTNTQIKLKLNSLYGKFVNPDLKWEQVGFWEDENVK